MVRKQLYIAPSQQRTLRMLARKTGKTEAQVLRDALDEHARALADTEWRVAAWRAVEKAIEKRARASRPATSRRWKREDLYDRNARTGRH